MEKLTKIKEKINVVLDFIYKYRFIIAAICLILGVLFSLHGSSINLWNSIYMTGIGDESVLLGNSRFIRSDEWAVTTPFVFSQAHNGFKYFSELLRGGTSTDAFSLYGLPVLSIAEIFRPFHLGYILLGLEKGLSFFWVAKFVALFLVSFEFGMILTNKNKRLSVIASFMITLSPLVQWWFATNGTVEILVFGMLAIILLEKYMLSENFKSRLWMLLFMMISAGTYLWVLYPPFQIPMFHVYLFIAAYIIIKNRKECKITKKDIISIICTILIFAGLTTYIILTSWDSIDSTMNTVYPGSRTETGGDAFRKMISYMDDLLLPYKELGIPTCLSEEATMFSLFPLGIICSIYMMIKNKKIDLLSILLFAPYILISLFCITGIPEWLAKITLLSFSASSRALMAVGFIDILLLLRALSNTEKSMKIWIAGILAVVCSAVVVFVNHKLAPNYVGIYSAIALFGICTFLFFTGLLYNTKYGKYFFTLGIIGTMFICGFTVNPIVHGIDMITESPLLISAKEIHEEDEGMWLVEAISFPGANYFIMNGIPTINSTNAYPNMDLYKKLDPEGKYEEIYNRYAHVYIEVVDAVAERFVLAAPDKINIYVTADELKLMDIKYVFTVRVMENYKNENVTFDLIYNENNYHIYKIDYLN